MKPITTLSSRNFFVRLAPIFSVVLLATVGCVNSPLPFSANRVGPNHPAALITANDPSGAAAEAASILKEVIEKMTGQALPILPESQIPPTGTVLLVGPSARTRAMGVDVPQDPQEPDGYVIKTRGRQIALVGNDAGDLHGTVYAAYDLLQRLGCRWYGPDPDWQIVPQVSSLRMPHLDVKENPAFRMRTIWRVNARQPYGKAWRIGGQKIHPGGHMLDAWVPRRLAETHPDWFHPGQPDICHPGVIAHVAQQFRKRLEKDGQFHSFGIGANDTHLWPESEYTRAVGNPGAQSLYFANGIADLLRPDFAGRFALSFYAYWVTQEPPDAALQAAPEVFVFFVNESNKAKPWDEPDAPEMHDFLKTQARNRRHFQGWVETGAHMGIYDWWIPGFIYREWRDLPWISNETTVRNLRYWHRHGVRHVTMESDYEHDTWPLIRWPLYYVGARAMWNPDIDADAVLQQACRDLFGTAADDMFSYYQTLDQAMKNTPYFQQNWNLPSPEQVYTPAVSAAASLHLAHAATQTVDEMARRRIAQETALWQKALDVLESARKNPRNFYRVYVDDKFMFWHQPSPTVATIRSLFGIPNQIPLFKATADGTVAATASDTLAQAVRYGEIMDTAADTTAVIHVEAGERVVTSRKP